MPQFVWFNSPTNHSGVVNFLFLNQDGAVDNVRLIVAGFGGPYLLDGPVLGDYDYNLTEAALKLVALMPAGIHVFPNTSIEDIKQSIIKNKDEITDKSKEIDILGQYDAHHRVFSNDYTTTQCCEMLLEDRQPKSTVVFVDFSKNGNVLLATELAKIYYGLSRERRKELGLGLDWNHRLEL